VAIPYRRFGTTYRYHLQGSLNHGFLEIYGRTRNQGTTENSHIEHRTHTSESIDVKVQNIDVKVQNIDVKVQNIDVKVQNIEHGK
jgi:hypothetical protein